MPDVCKNLPVLPLCLTKTVYVFGAIKTDGTGSHLWFGLVHHATAGQFLVLACSQQALCYYAKNTEEQLGNVKDIHQSDCPHCR